MDLLRQSLQHTAGACSAVIRASLPRPGGATDGFSRCQVLVCSDVEAQCLAVTGGSAVQAQAQVQAPAAAASAAAAGFHGGASSLLSSVLKPMRLFGVGREAAAPGGGALCPGGSEQQSGAAEALAAVVRAQLDAAFPPSPSITAAHLAPITDVVVLHGDDAPPPGFTRLSHSVTGMYAGDLNAASGTKQLWLAVSRAPDAAPVTALLLVAVDKGEFLPPGFTPVRRYVRGVFGRAANLRYGMSSAPSAASAAAAAAGSDVGGRSGAGGGAAPAPTPSSASAEAELLLCLSRSLGAPIIDLGICFPTGALALPNIAAGMLPAALRPAYKPAALALAPPRPSTPGGPWGTLAALEAEAAATPTMAAGAAAVSESLRKTLGPAQEPLPPGYALLARTVLGSGGMLSGGSARGPAALCYAKDCSHVDALGDAAEGVGELEARMCGAAAGSGGSGGVGGGLGRGRGQLRLRPPGPASPGMQCWQR